MVTLPWTSTAKADPTREYVVLATALPLRRYRTIPRFFRLFRRVNEQLHGTPGVVGWTMRAAFLRKRFWTLSVWDDERALAAFVGRAPHVDVMDALSGTMSAPKFVRWRVRGSEVPPSWDVALAKLALG